MVRAIVAIAVTALSLAAAEVAFRIIDGYAIPSLLLQPARPTALTSPRTGKFDSTADVASYVDSLPVAAGVDRRWFTDAELTRPTVVPDADLRRRAERFTGQDALYINYEWNEQYLRRVVCHGTDSERAPFKAFDDVFVFDPTDGTEWPTFRFLRAVTYPDGLRTNAFGWRSQEIRLKHSSRTIRIAFVGASTTQGPHGGPYTYPELVGIWLNRWAESRHRGLVFETINAGREGINSRSIQAVVTQEVMPVSPDFIVYYEGANQMSPGDYLGPTTLPPRPRESGPRPVRLAAYSDMAGRIDRLLRRAVMPGDEPVKPILTVHWPADLDERDPDLTYPNLPVNLRQILADLETIRRASEAGGSRLVMTSFMWLVYPGMVVDPVRDEYLFRYLNEVYWPFSYAHMRRFIDFQERVFRKYAAAHKLEFIDFANEYPRDPRLFSDAIHMTWAGIRLQAWIVFNGLVPAIERAIAAGTLPRSGDGVPDTHPAFGPRRHLDVAAARAACTLPLDKTK